jgi:hypothetical protein
MAKKAGMKVGKWREQRPLETLSGGQYGASEKAARKTAQEKKATRKSLDAKLYDTHKARAKAAGSSVKKLIRVERELAREAGIKIGEWHKEHPLESLTLGQYDTYKTASEASTKPAKPEATSADHRLNQIRAEAVGLPVTQLRDIEQELAEKAGMSTVAWRK